MKPSVIAAAVLGTCLSILSIFGPAPAHADGFSVNPTHLELKPSQSATSVTIANYNDAPLFMQVRVYRWERKDGVDSLSEVEGSDAPLVTPPLFRLAPGGGSQVVRIGFLKTAAASAEERQWRVIVEEVPKAAPAGGESSSEPQADSESSAASLSIAIHVRVSLPLFERPQTMRQDLKWSLTRSAGAQVTLTAENLGTVTERLDEISLSSHDKGSAHKPGPLYIFPGERRTFDLQPDVALPAGNIHLSVQGTPRPLTHELVLSAQ